MTTPDPPRDPHAPEAVVKRLAEYIGHLDNIPFTEDLLAQLKPGDRLQCSGQECVVVPTLLISQAQQLVHIYDTGGCPAGWSTPIENLRAMLAALTEGRDE